ncbi:hypothetical protein ASPWEDRAFT_174082 [Aspergillus wentii DTO 134E9]|uniref:Uncharacterized protein n=1 Tax=Aspergillus wentii DTO 134E9 TaxID=1073089 RepID=A0A1L9RCJ6_ASPWE|nr:uncharacterized protein ASPWEDRAFT_174082 [Aspergillus wentii DTO 134E9]OJJ32631.1 hypothetical protein ASPWEDRAFT_174082 [Aspergillus wentii DTO 134E9]
MTFLTQESILEILFGIPSMVTSVLNAWDFWLKYRVRSHSKHIEPQSISLIVPHDLIITVEGYDPEGSTIRNQSCSVDSAQSQSTFGQMLSKASSTLTLQTPPRVFISERRQFEHEV